MGIAYRLREVEGHFLGGDHIAGVANLVLRVSLQAHPAVALLRNRSVERIGVGCHIHSSFPLQDLSYGNLGKAVAHRGKAAAAHCDFPLIEEFLQGIVIRCADGDLEGSGICGIVGGHADAGSNGSGGVDLIHLMFQGIADICSHIVCPVAQPAEGQFSIEIDSFLIRIACGIIVVVQVFVQLHMNPVFGTIGDIPDDIVLAGGSGPPAGRAADGLGIVQIPLVEILGAVQHLQTEECIPAGNTGVLGTAVGGFLEFHGEGEPLAHRIRRGRVNAVTAGRSRGGNIGRIHVQIDFLGRDDIVARHGVGIQRIACLVGNLHILEAGDSDPGASFPHGLRHRDTLEGDVVLSDTCHGQLDGFRSIGDAEDCS